MKKLIGTFLVVLAFVSAIPAQAQFRYGVVAGLNLSKMSLSGSATDNWGSGNRTGWYIGPKVEFTVPLVGLGFDASLQYSQRKLHREDENNTGETSKTLRSIEIPVNVRYTIGFSSLASVYAATGPQFGINIGNKDWSDVNTTLKSSAVTWNIGAGVTLLNHLQAGVIYNIALGKINDKYKGTGDLKLKTNTWQVQVAYLF